MSRPPCLRLVLATSVAAVVLAAIPLPVRGLVVDAVQDAIHAAGFAGFAFLLVRCATTRGIRDAAHRRRRFVAAILCLLALAVITEGLQFYTPRDSSPGDFIRDLLGVGIGVGLAVATMTNTPRVRVLLVLLSLLGSGVAIAPVASAVEAARHRAGSLPVIHEFEETWERHFIVRRGAEAHLARVGSRTFLDVRLVEPFWPAVILDEVPPDWTAYATLVLDVENLESEPIRIGVRLDDHVEALDYADRFQRGFDLRPGWQTLRIPLDEVAAEVTTRDFDLRHVESIAVFATSETPRPMRIRLDRIRLEPADQSTSVR